MGIKLIKYEFDVRDEYDSESEHIPGKDNKKFVVQMFGIDTDGKTASIFVKGFDPFFYIKVGDDWTDGDMMGFVNHIKRKMGQYYSDSLIKPKLLRGVNIYRKYLLGNIASMEVINLKKIK